MHMMLERLEADTPYQCRLKQDSVGREAKRSL